MLLRVYDCNGEKGDRKDLRTRRRTLGHVVLESCHEAVTDNILGEDMAPCFIISGFQVQRVNGISLLVNDCTKSHQIFTMPKLQLRVIGLT